MQKVESAGGVRVSRLGFGCAPIMGRIGKSDALRAMSSAYDCGVTHFDIARSYGFGEAEAVLGDFLRTRKDATVTTKFGVIPPQLRTWQRLARPVVRMARQHATFLKKAIKRNSGVLLSKRNYGVEYAEECLESSLRNLAREQIDFYLIHEPDRDDLQAIDALRQFLEDSVKAGKIGQWGIAYPEEIPEDADTSEGTVVQFAANTQAHLVSHLITAKQLCFVTRPFGGGAALDGGGLVEKLAAQLECSAAMAAIALATYQAGDNGAVIAGMFHTDHIRRNVNSMNEYIARKGEIDHAIDAVMLKGHE